MDDNSKHNKKLRKQAIKKGGDQAQTMVNEQMRRALEADQYSAVGSVVDTDSDREEPSRTVPLDRATILAAMRKRVWMERQSRTQQEEEDYDNEENASLRNTNKSTTLNKKRPKSGVSIESCGSTAIPLEELNDDVMDRDEGSIFGQSTGTNNATWVECDKCKKVSIEMSSIRAISPRALKLTPFFFKWRRLRGMVDEKKLPSKWYCTMNKNDLERARCSAPEEEYETPNTPESAADARTRKHLRVWVRRLESNQAYEGRQPTMTRGKKRSATSSSKEPYEWIRCCNPSCGKWRALLKVMDSKSLFSVCKDGEWYCVQNTWDEKMASCAAPQENLPAIGCPPWVMQDE